MNLTKYQARMVKDHNLDYFKDNDFSPDLKQLVLNYAVSLAKINIIQHYMEQGIKLTQSAPLIDLMRKNAKIDTLQYLQTKGVNFDDSVLLISAIKEKKLKFAQFIVPQITNWENSSLKIAIKSSIESFDDLNQANKLINTLLKNISSELINELLDEISDPRLNDKKTFLLNQFLKINLPEDNNKIKKIKI